MSSKKAKKKSGPSRPDWDGLVKRARSIRLELIGIIILVGLATFFLMTSWRKWPDSLIDFGNSLYIAWRLAGGAVLYRDVDVDYGPASQYFNGLLFHLFGPGMMVIVAANLVGLAAILTVLYLLFRRAWGASAAFAACAVFIVVFAFSQSVLFGNYNYVTPHAQESTHGILTCLLLVVVLLQWTQTEAKKWSWSAGFLFGLTTVLKPEFMLAGGAIVIAAALARRKTAGSIRPTSAALAAAGAVLPTLAFTAYFLLFVGTTKALTDACHAWLNTVRLGSDMAQIRFLGFDAAWQHLGEHLLAAFWAAVLIGTIAAVSRLADRVTMSRRCLIALAALLFVGIGAASFFLVSWREAGRCLLGLVGAYVVACTLVMARRKLGGDQAVRVRRLLISVLALALLSRMVLNVRYYQYGYYQAALAAVLIPAVLVGEFPSWLNLRETGKRFMFIGCAALMIPGLIVVANKSQVLLRLKTYPIAEGTDLFYSYPPAIDAQGEVVDRVVKALRADSDARTLVVLPEGALINYLSRLPSPIAPLFFYSGITEDGGEEQIVQELKQHPPDLIVVIARDLRDYGILRYGERVGAGQEIIRWVKDDYESIGRIGGDPLDYRQRGALLLRRKSATN